ncbi:MAG TPA: hypothetical protein VIJ76_00395 [Galbitalea sp.]
MEAKTSTLVLVRSLDELFDRRQQHARDAAAGRETRVARGAYIKTPLWAQLGQRGQYLLRIRAVVATRRRSMVLSHWSAAAIHGLPVIGRWPTAVHVIVGPVSGGRSRNGVVKHALTLRDEDVVEVDGLLVTSVARTVLDMAISADPLTAVIAADRALLVDRFRRRPPLASREDLVEAWNRAMPFRGHRRAEHVIEFGETRAESPLESVSRLNMWVIGCPRPVLQQSFSDAEGYIGDTDFFWPDLQLTGEADGEIKYLDEEMRGGRSADQVVLDEKDREDRIRALRKGMTRWRWEVGVNPSALRAHLVHAGLPMGRRW